MPDSTQYSVFFSLPCRPYIPFFQRSLWIYGDYFGHCDEPRPWSMHRTQEILLFLIKICLLWEWSVGTDLALRVFSIGLEWNPKRLCEGHPRTIGKASGPSSWVPIGKAITSRFVSTSVRSGCKRDVGLSQFHLYPCRSPLLKRLEWLSGSRHRTELNDAEVNCSSLQRALGAQKAKSTGVSSSVSISRIYLSYC